MIQLQTRWCQTVDKSNPLPEYPRPHMVRDSYLNLNGEWEYCINESEEVQAYDGKIVVPFSPETLLSGVQKIVRPEDYLHYKKVFQIPAGFQKSRVLLHFDGVDQECQVWLNGTELGYHKGGYLPFVFDITEGLQAGDNVLTLRVKDWTEQSPHARGKQKLVKKGRLSSLFYTPQSGIWKTVWLESVPEDYINDIKITPLYDDAAVKIQVLATGAAGSAPREVQIQILDGGRLLAEAEGKSDSDIAIDLADFEAWAPENPKLYDVTVIMGEDRIESYFGMRKVSVGRDKRGLLRFCLNNKPFFFNGVLDQGYWPESLLTAPCEEALIYDIEKMKDLGYNTIRKHIKVEPERFYYHCDRLGMLVWQDMPNGGGEYNMFFVAYLTNGFDRFARGIKDSHYSWFKRTDKAGRDQYYEDLAGMVSLLYNHPSIVTWVPFNEGWGQFDAAKATELIRSLDSTRLVNEACGWFDQQGGDMYSIHNYIRKLKVKPQDRVVALTEYGGYAYPVPGHMACEKEFGYQHYRSMEELTANYQKLWEEQIYPNLEKGLSSAIYTQTSDIEEEINGLMTYDREIDKLTPEVVRALNRRLYEQFAGLSGD